MWFWWHHFNSPDFISIKVPRNSWILLLAHWCHRVENLWFLQFLNSVNDCILHWLEAQYGCQPGRLLIPISKHPFFPLTFRIRLLKTSFIFLASIFCSELFLFLIMFTCWDFFGLCLPLGVVWTSALPCSPPKGWQEPPPSHYCRVCVPLSCVWALDLPFPAALDQHLGKPC